MPESNSQAAPTSPPASRPSNGKVGTSRGAFARSRSKVLPARPEHIDALLSDGLRAADEAELEALGRAPEETLWASLESSGLLVFTIFVDGVPAGMFGVVGTPVVDVGTPWMLGTDRLPTAARDLLREAPLWVEFINSVYPTLINFVDSRNTIAISWLQRMGFEFNSDDITLDSGVVFRRFTRCASP